MARRNDERGLSDLRGNMCSQPVTPAVMPSGGGGVSTHLLRRNWSRGYFLLAWDSGYLDSFWLDTMFSFGSQDQSDVSSCCSMSEFNDAMVIRLDEGILH